MQSPILSQSASEENPFGGSGRRSSLTCNEELGVALEHGLGLPLSALRASMESLQHSMPEGTQSKRSINGALQKVQLISRNIHDLMDLAMPPSPMPLRCSVQSIADSARGSLPAEQRGRVLLANMAGDTSVHMDAPLVTRCLRRLIDNAFEAGTEFVLLTLRSQAGRTSFTVVDAAPGNFDSDWALTAFHSDKRHHMGLGLSLVARDMELLGGTLHIERCPTGESTVTLELPDECSLHLLEDDDQEQLPGVQS